jgi:hypothetical protein
MSYLDNEFNTDFDDDVENLDELAPMEGSEIIDKTNDENYKIISDMFKHFNDYVNDKSHTLPIIQYLNRTNFDKWFSQFIIPNTLL